MKLTSLGMGAMIALAGITAAAVQAATIVPGSVVTANVTGSGQSSVTTGAAYSQFINPDTVVVVGAAWEAKNNLDITSISWAGQSFSQVVGTASTTRENPTQNYTESEYWIAKPELGAISGALTVTWNAATSEANDVLFITIQTIQKVAGEARGSAGGSNYNTTITQPVATTASGELVLSLFVHGAASASTVASSSTPGAATVIVNDVKPGIAGLFESITSVADNSGLTSHTYTVASTQGGPAYSSLSVSVLAFPVPEPTSLSLLAVGAAGLLLRRRKTA